MNDFHSEGNGKSGKAIASLGKLVLKYELKNMRTKTLQESCLIATSIKETVVATHIVKGKRRPSFILACPINENRSLEGN